VTRTPLSRSKGQGHQTALLTAVLTRQTAAVVSVGTYWPWETTAALRSARRREALRRPQSEERGGGHIVAAAAYSLLLLFLTLGNHDPEGGLKIRKIYKKLGMSSNPCSHDLANCHAKEQR